ncbi:nose resistant to fluoxetine protein 6-like [Chrysoperla carnea]|uniref:nose resistant to fluoxetine protein 6-like n=1 Tax=Chrysoperla carnea TaxID=189513 RepID=UPI001D075C14|nr:nose resistant to fluoxetine protein 6-like [Chrysoperla carnea]
MYLAAKVTPSAVTINNILDNIKFYTLQSDVELSDLCRKQSDIYYKTLITGTSTKDEWAKEMMDASSKIQAGIYFGNIADLGAFDECLRINSDKEHIKGKYCLTKLNVALLHDKSVSRTQKLLNHSSDNHFPETFTDPPSTPALRWSICVPDGCTAEDVQAHLNSYNKNLNFTVKEEFCQTVESQPKLNTGDWATIGILIALACVILLSTCYDIFLYQVQKDPIHPLTIAFSWFTNFKKLIKINNNPDLLPCLNGIRVISILWIIHGHETDTMGHGVLFNGKEAMNFNKRTWSLFTLSSSVAVDSFFFLSGLLLMFGFLKSRARKIPFNIPLFYIHRYLRVTPPFAALVILYITFYMKLGSGPIWESNNQILQDSCKEYWWSSVLHIQNFVNPNKYCSVPSWYLSVDMQLYILAPLILIPIGKWPKITSYLFGILVIAFTIIPTIVAWQYEIPALALNGEIPDFQRVYYAQVHTRAGPWVIGLALGYILFITKNKTIRINKILAASLWLLTAVAMVYIVFGLYPALRDDFQYSRLFSSIFTGFHRNVWTLGLCWIVFACIHGYGGPVNWFLSLPVFQFFGKITYALYLLHDPKQNYVSGVSRVPFIFQDFTILQSYFSTLCLSTLFSIVWVLCFETPFGVIDGVIIKAVSNWKKKESKQRS